MNNKLQKFHDEVALKHHLYNGLFLTLPFTGTEETGALLSAFSRYCHLETKKDLPPQKILESFFRKYPQNFTANDKIDNIFKMLQFIERQIVLFDTLEDAAFPETHDLNGPGSLQNLIAKVEYTGKQSSFIKNIADYHIRIVLTAHPTQFYPKQVLAILPQLIEAFKKNNLLTINELLTQMGKTSFSNREKPTPFQEAKIIVWYLENTLYPVIPKIQTTINETLAKFGHPEIKNPNAITLGFWPGGDRDGNPFVTAETTLEVARMLKTRILGLYLKDLRTLAMKLTFVGILEKIDFVRNKLNETHLHASIEHQETPGEIYYHSNELLQDLEEIKTILIRDHNSLFIDSLNEIITKIQCFGFHFAAMDMRENSSMHREVTENTIKSIQTIKEIQSRNGEKGLCRYIISNTQSDEDVLQVLALLKHHGQFSSRIPVDIVPLFESIEDLEHAEAIMKKLYKDPIYLEHLKHRKYKQTIMVGFSDGTKDGGYVAANWSIYKAKVKLTELSKKMGIEVIFFDGRGGPPGRGGGNTHNFYRSLGSKIRHNHNQLTIQGQTIGVTFGTKDSSKFNIEQFFTAGINDLIFPEEANDLTKNEIGLIDHLSEESIKSYLLLKKDPLFVPYLEQITPLKFYGELNIGSRPSSRRKDNQFRFSDLRAIPFVGSWSQIKQNIPGYYGFGYALHKLIQAGKEKQLKHLYEHSLFFRTLANNSMMALSKTNFKLTEYLRKDKKFGLFWKKLNEETEQTTKLLLNISDQNALLENDPINRISIKIREDIVLPLLIIQQSALLKLQSIKNPNSKDYLTYKKIVMKALTANTNASRNSA